MVTILLSSALQRNQLCTNSIYLSFALGGGSWVDWNGNVLRRWRVGHDQPGKKLAHLRQDLGKLQLLSQSRSLPDTARNWDKKAAGIELLLLLQLNLHFNSRQIQAYWSGWQWARRCVQLSRQGDEAGGCRDQQVSVGVERVHQVRGDFIDSLPEKYRGASVDINIVFQGSWKERSPPPISS